MPNKEWEQEEEKMRRLAVRAGGLESGNTVLRKKLTRLENELAEYREFVGQLALFQIFDSDGNRVLASGTDPFDAWVQLREGEDEN